MMSIFTILTTFPRLKIPKIPKIPISVKMRTFWTRRLLWWPRWITRGPVAAVGRPWTAAASAWPVRRTDHAGRRARRRADATDATPKKGAGARCRAPFLGVASVALGPPDAYMAHKRHLPRGRAVGRCAGRWASPGRGLRPHPDCPCWAAGGPLVRAAGKITHGSSSVKTGEPRGSIRVKTGAARAAVARRPGTARGSNSVEAYAWKRHRSGEERGHHDTTSNGLLPHPGRARPGRAGPLWAALCPPWCSNRAPGPASGPAPPGRSMAPARNCWVSSWCSPRRPACLTPGSARTISPGSPRRR